MKKLIIMLTMLILLATPSYATIAGINSSILHAWNITTSDLKDYVGLWNFTDNGGADTSSGKHAVGTINRYINDSTGENLGTPAVTMHREYSMSLWLNMTAYSLGYFLRYRGSGTDANYIAIIGLPGAGTVKTETGGGLADITCEEENFTLNEYTHIAYATNNTQATWWIDGVICGSVTGTKSGATGTGKVFYLGDESGNANAWTHDELVIWNDTFFNQSEVDELYNSGDGFFFPFDVAGALSCGDTITESTTMTDDLNCSGTGTNGINFGADDITLNCAGFTILGDNSANKKAINATGRDNIAIQNCDILSWDDGIFLSNTDNSLIQNNNMTVLGFGFEASSSDFNDILTNQIHSTADDGAGFTSSTFNVLNSNNISSGGGGGDFGLTLGSLSNSNNLTNNIVLAPADDGMLIFSSSDNIIIGNNITGGSGVGDFGVKLLTNSDDNIFIGGFISSGGDAGIVMDTSDNNLFNNTNVTGSEGFEFVSSSNNNITNAVFSGSVNDIEVDADITPTSLNNWFINSTFDKSDIMVSGLGNVVHIATYVRVNVTDNATDLPLKDALTDANSSSTFGVYFFDSATEADGLTPITILREFVVGVASTYVYDTNYTLNITRTTYFPSLLNQWNITPNPIFQVQLDLIPIPNVSLLSPTDEDINNSLNMDFLFNVTSNLTIVNCSLWTSETAWTLKESNQTTITKGVANTINHNFSSNGDFLWNTQCYDEFNRSSFDLSNRTITIDTVNPICNNFTDAILFNNSFFNWSVICTDLNFFSLNVSCTGSDNFSFYEDNLNATVFNFTNSTLITEVTTCEIEYCDGHTASAIENIEISDRNSSRKRTFDNKISISSSVTFEHFTTEYREDRIGFILNYSLPRSKLDFTVTSDEFIHIIGNDRHHGWLVTGDYWVDFDNENILSSSIRRESSNEVVVTLNFKKSITTINFDSIGKINCVQETQQISLKPPVGGLFFNIFNCPLDESTSFVLGYFGVVAFLFIILLFNELFFKIPFITLFIGLAFVFVSLPIYACSPLIATPITLFAIMLWVVEFIRFK